MPLVTLEFRGIAYEFPSDDAEALRLALQRSGGNAADAVVANIESASGDDGTVVSLDESAARVVLSAMNADSSKAPRGGWSAATHRLANALREAFESYNAGPRAFHRQGS
jgi:hypothetical protein